MYNLQKVFVQASEIIVREFHNLLLVIIIYNRTSDSFKMSTSILWQLIAVHQIAAMQAKPRHLAPKQETPMQTSQGKYTVFSTVGSNKNDII